MTNSEMYEELLKSGSRKVRGKFSEAAVERYEEIFREAEMVSHLLHIQKLRCASGFPSLPAIDNAVWISQDLRKQYHEHWNAAKNLAAGSSRLKDLFDSLQRMSGEPGDLPEKTFCWDEMASILTRDLRLNCARIAVLNRGSRVWGKLSP